MIRADRLLAGLVFLCLSAGAALGQQADPIARAEIAHVRELLIAADRRYEQRFDAQEKAVGAALSAAKEAVIKAEGATEKRFEGVNEFRRALADQQTTFMTRKETDQQLSEMTRQLRELQMRLDKAEGVGTGAWNLWVLIGGALLLIAAVIGVVLRMMSTKAAE